MLSPLDKSVCQVKDQDQDLWMWTRMCLICGHRPHLLLMDCLITFEAFNYVFSHFDLVSNLPVSHITV